MSTTGEENMPGLSVLNRIMAPAAPAATISRLMGSLVLISSVELDLINQKFIYKEQGKVDYIKNMIRNLRHAYELLRRDVSGKAAEQGL